MYFLDIPNTPASPTIWKNPKELGKTEVNNDFKDKT